MQNFQLLFGSRRRRCHSCFQMCSDLTAEPGPTLGGSTDHDTGCAGVGEYLGCLLRRVDITIGIYRNINRTDNGSDGVVLCVSGEGAEPSAAVYR